MAQTVAFVGLGSMGAGMARSLVRNEFTVRGYDIRSEPLERLGADGGQDDLALARVMEQLAGL